MKDMKTTGYDITPCDSSTKPAIMSPSTCSMESEPPPSCWCHGFAIRVHNSKGLPETCFRRRRDRRPTNITH